LLGDECAFTEEERRAGEDADIVPCVGGLRVLRVDEEEEDGEDSVCALTRCACVSEGDVLGDGSIFIVPRIVVVGEEGVAVVAAVVAVRVRDCCCCCCGL